VRAALATLVVAAAVLAAGCGAVGRVTGGDAAAGKALFLANPDPKKPSCATCHTLADAGAKGTIGPNLDDAFESVRTKAGGSFDESTIRDVVRGQIAYAEDQPSTGSPGMPQNLLRGKDAQDVATYVAKCAGVPACGVQAAKTAPPTTTAATTTGGAAAKPDGKQVFASAGCGTCHTFAAAGATGKIGPDLDKLKQEATKAGKPLDAFIKQSIVDPNAYVAPGFQPNVMPATFGKSIPPDQLDALVKFLAQNAK
jgi:cytochrome c2